MLSEYGLGTFVLILVYGPYVEGSFTYENRSEIEVLRRQLKLNNYDYDYSLEDTGKSKENITITTKKSTLSEKYKPEIKKLKRFKVRADSGDDTNYSVNEKKGASRNRYKHSGNFYNAFPNTFNYDETTPRNVANNKYIATERVSYQILKNVHPSRRAGDSKYILKETSNEVAVLLLDGEPFSPLNLPPVRRQYMQNRHVMVGAEDEAILPPPVNEPIYNSTTI